MLSHQDGPCPTVVQTHSRVSARIPKTGLWELANKKEGIKHTGATAVQLISTTTVREYVCKQTEEFKGMKDHKPE